jgi:hypothetical protein
MLNSTAPPAHFKTKWAGVAVLFSWQLPNRSHDIADFFSNFLKFFNYETIDTHALAFFLTHIILAIVVDILALIG